MDSFASKDIQYPDGQPNKVVVPAEIQESGFKPPVRASNGELILGDALSANHLNYILNDLYNQLKSAPKVTKKTGDSGSGTRVFSNGDIEMWGLASVPSSGILDVVYPIPLPDITYDIRVTDTGDLNAASVRIGGGSTKTGFRIYASNSQGVGVSRAVYWKVVYHG